MCKNSDCCLLLNFNFRGVLALQCSKPFLVSSVPNLNLVDLNVMFVIIDAKVMCWLCFWNVYFCFVITKI